MDFFTHFFAMFSTNKYFIFNLLDFSKSFVRKILETLSWSFPNINTFQKYRKRHLLTQTVAKIPNTIEYDLAKNIFITKNSTKKVNKSTSLPVVLVNMKILIENSWLATLIKIIATAAASSLFNVLHVISFNYCKWEWKIKKNSGEWRN